ncbi:GGDEF domain-containing protein [Kovacikia minuta CCNUW1]|uniref:GGDEF domain-containing protein n=1 Tax=Kovacikia minuta TaxID=2931930 RepID=UPI001CCBC472|nr:GGDEF domain-containing protein [Kovacikia minuta]UBF25382.1 GGDEF domain-containing protein [Kovacikia minuta CCNUW1]
MKQLGKSFINYWKQQPSVLVVGVGALLVVLIGIIDYFTITDISLAIFYLIPITFVTWFASRWFGFLVALEAAIAWWLVDLLTKSDAYFWLISWNAMINFGFFSITAYLLSNLKFAYERQKYLARTDALTGAVNHRHFLELLQTEIDRSRRYGYSLTLAYVDVDNFKTVNDRLGHSAGDRLLYLISQTAYEQIRSIDILARLGGDEFALLLPQTNYEQGETVLLRLHEKWMEAVQKSTFPVSFSVGAATFNRLPESADTVLEQVDCLMYSVKNGGKNGLKHVLVDHQMSGNRAAES